MMISAIEFRGSDGLRQRLMILMTSRMIRSVLVRPKDNHDTFGIFAVRGIFNKVVCNRRGGD